MASDFQPNMEDTMPRGKRKSKEQWCALVNEYTESGQTVEQFSLEAGFDIQPIQVDEQAQFLR
jgi:hypothetical protein